MKKFQEYIWEARTEQCAEERKRARRRQKRDREFFQKLFLQMLFLLFLAAALGVALFQLEPVRAAASEIFSAERIAAGMDAPDSVDEITVETISEDYENPKIEAALLDKAHEITDCTVTWYTADTCNKKPGDPGYGITYSGLPVEEHLTCAVDPAVIPLYSDVFVQYADGSIEQLWATDTGVSGNALDIYTPDHDYAMQCGRQTLTVWWVAEDTQ